MVTEAGAALADERGLGRLSTSAVADRLGVGNPSLYEHVDGLAALERRIAVRAATEVGDPTLPPDAAECGSSAGGWQDGRRARAQSAMV
ncbi:TetR family transcriptional regulator [Rathayibacter sp. VKM Ac-2803]|uniref:TetR family transcriptional regulator n=1 Tax=Rathayibacter sp. VKM Ac-2803 TaxID=2609256 RepID=UPI0013591B53|nr:TetR family transcriptional regulator [Rathayibacter sp. VKM Ac-2803]MWV49295.1 TetR family transcriptional regulator [Rathayibacter sp. VKM Ac-2803]